MNGDALEIINALNSRIDSLRIELSGDITNSRLEITANILTLESRISQKIQDDQKDHKMLKRAIVGIAVLVSLSLGASPGGEKLLTIIGHLL